MAIATLKREHRGRFIQKVEALFEASIQTRDYRRAARLTIQTMLHYMPTSDLYKILRYANALFQKIEQKNNN